MNSRGDKGWGIAVAGDDYQLNFLVYAAYAFGLNEGDNGVQVDLVYAGIQEPLLVSDNYFVMGPSRDFLWNEDWWLRLFRENY